MYDPNFLGKNGFVWFIGVVEDRLDPLKLGRVRVRCFGWHTENKQEIPTDSLPWASVSHPTTSSSNSGIGQNSKLLEGTWVTGFFLDGIDCQNPIVIGTLPGLQARGANSNIGFNDPRTDIESPLSVQELQNSLGSPVNITDAEPKSYPLYTNEPGTSRLARGENLDGTILPSRESHAQLHSGIPTAEHTTAEGSDSAIAGGEFSEPTVPYNAVYPYNQVTQSESGHVIEIDDTPGAERIHIYHRSGSNIEIHPDGSVVSHTSNNKFDLIDNNEHSHVGGNSFKTVQKQMRLKIIGEGLVVEASDKISITVHGNCNLKVDGDVNELVDGNVNRHVVGNVIETIDGNIERVVSGSVTETVSGPVNETYGPLTQEVTGPIVIDSSGPQNYTAPQINLN